jgi:3-oxoacyl-(acyl-carrier-protein) synthase
LTASAESIPRVSVTGLGMISPLGAGYEAAWKVLLDSKCSIEPIHRFDPIGLPVSLAAEVVDFVAPERVGRRLLVKSDRFAHYAMAATAETLDDAELDLATEDPFRVGISFGNNSGGWDICERGFQEYYGEGPRMINPFQATAWFPSAPQGFISICYKVRGYSKSFACDRASDGCALYFGVRAIRWDRVEIVLCGGCEAPITRLGMAALVSTGELSRATDPNSGYLPFSADRNGLVVGEGSAVVVLENTEHARRRGARVYVDILAVEQRTGDPRTAVALEQACAAALRTAGCAAGDIDLVLAEGCGTESGDRVEALTIRRLLGDVPVTVPKAAMGHLYGASASSQLVLAALAIRDNVLPPTVGTRRAAEDCPIRLVTAAEPAPVNMVMIIARSREGTNVVLIVRTPR